MAKQTRISNAAAVALCNALVALLDSGSTLRLYDGVVPSEGDAPITSQNLLAQIVLPFPTFGAAVDGGGKATASISSLISGAATAAGLATFFRACNSFGNTVAQGTVGVINCDLTLSSNNLVPGVSVRVNSWNIHVSENQTVC